MPRICEHPDGCDRPHDSGGWCKMHAARVRRHGDPGPVGAERTKQASVCSVDGCGRPPHGHNLCTVHLPRMKRYGDPTTDVGDRLRWPMNLLSRLMFMPNGCVEYTGCINATGYGWIAKDGTQALTHRAAYELVRGPIPEGLTLDHLCRNTRCCNPHHLEPVTNSENVRRALAVRYAA